LTLVVYSGILGREISRCLVNQKREEIMTKEELLRMKGYWLLLAARDGELDVLTPGEQFDLKQLIEKWMKENYS